MTQKDYILLANTVKALDYAAGQDVNGCRMVSVAALARALAVALAGDNPTRFDSARFLSACGVSGKE